MNMASRPIIKDGVVINVTVIDDDCAIMTKAECRKQEAAEKGAYEEQAKAWREQVMAMRAEVDAAQRNVGLARATLEAVKTRAATEKHASRKSAMLDQILALDGEVKAHLSILNDLAARPVPAKPRLTRGKRWFHADDVVVGPPGGDIGDSWDGSKYVKPSAGADAKP
jgi:dGTP triphosphohydrolase